MSRQVSITFFCLFIFNALLYLNLLLVNYQGPDQKDVLFTRPTRHQLFIIDNVYNDSPSVHSSMSMYLVIFSIPGLYVIDTRNNITRNFRYELLLCIQKHFLIALYFSYYRSCIIALTPPIISFIPGCYSNQLWQIIRCCFVRLSPPWPNSIFEIKVNNGGWHWYL